MRAPQRSPAFAASAVAAVITSGCVVVQSPSARGGDVSARIVPTSVHLERGHVYAQAFVEAGERADITMTVEGPGASAAPVLRRCSYLGPRGPKRAFFDCRPLENVQINLFEPRWLDSQSVALDPAGAAPGAYTLRILVGGQVAAEQRFTLVEAPTVGAKGTLVVAPQERPNTLVLDGKRAHAWLRIDGRASWGGHYMRFAWFRDGALVHSQDANFEPRYLHKIPTQSNVDLDAPVVDVRPFALELPKDAMGSWTVVATLDAAVPMGSWDLTLSPGSLGGEHAESLGAGNGPLPVGFVTGARTVPDKLVELAKAPHHLGPPSSPAREQAVCADAFEPGARPLLEKLAQLSGASWALLGVASAAYQDEYRNLARTALAQGRITEDGKGVYVTQGELDRAGRRGDARSAGADAERQRVQAESKRVGQQLKQMSEKYKPGCLHDGLAAKSPLLLE